jgi:hypothetical protein
VPGGTRGTDRVLQMILHVAARQAQIAGDRRHGSRARREKRHEISSNRQWTDYIHHTHMIRVNPEVPMPIHR